MLGSVWTTYCKYQRYFSEIIVNLKASVPIKVWRKTGDYTRSYMRKSALWLLNRWFSKKLQQKRKLSSPLPSPFHKREIICQSQCAVFEEVSLKLIVIRLRVEDSPWNFPLRFTTRQISGPTRNRTQCLLETCPPKMPLVLYPQQTALLDGWKPQLSKRRVKLGFRQELFYGWSQCFFYVSPSRHATSLVYWNL